MLLTPFNVISLTAMLIACRSVIVDVCTDTTGPKIGSVIWTSYQRKVPTSCNSTTSPFVWKPTSGVVIETNFSYWRAGEPNCATSKEVCMYETSRFDYRGLDGDCSLKCCPLCEYGPLYTDIQIHQNKYLYRFLEFFCLLEYQKKKNVRSLKSIFSNFALVHYFAYFNDDYFIPVNTFFFYFNCSRRSISEFYCMLLVVDLKPKEFRSTVSGETELIGQCNP